MTSLYLKHISLRQFRSFSSLDLELPAEPGVLIIYGSNGLGKSSLFNAIEWTLSDRIDHFSLANGVDKQGSYLCRWREDTSEPTKVTLKFSDDGILERSLLNAKSTKSQLGGNVPDITAFLRAPAWQQSISELDRYLWLTHFLGQSNMSRFTGRKSTERFDILKEAAQSTAIEDISNSIHGQGNNTVARAYTRQIEALERDFTQLGHLLEQEGTLWVEAQMSGAIDDVSAAIEARRIMGLLAGAKLEGAASGSSDAEEAPSVEELQATTDQIERECLAVEARLDNARRIYGDGQRALADLAEVIAARTNTKIRLDDLGSELEQALQLQIKCNTDVTAHQQLLTEKSTLVSRLLAVREARGLVSKLESDQLDWTAARDAAVEEKLTAEYEVARSERLRQILRRLSGEVTQSDEDIERLLEGARLIDHAIAAEERVRIQSDALARLENSNPDINSQIVRAEKAVETATAKYNEQVVIVERLRETIDSLSAAISSIAANLPADSCECPVCATPFETAAALHVQVSTAANRLAPVLVVQQELSKSLMVVRDTRTAELQQFIAMRTMIDAARALLSVELEQQGRLIARINSDSLTTTVALVARQSHFASAIEAKSARRDRKRRWKMRLELGSGASNADHSLATRARDAAQRTLDARIRALDDLKAAIARAKADEGSASSALAADHQVPNADLAAILQNAEADLRRVHEELTAAVSALTHANSVVAGLEADREGMRGRLAEIDARKTNLVQTQQGINDEWIELQTFGPVLDLEPLQRVERRLSASASIIRDGRSQIARLSQGRLALSRQRSHRAVLERIQALVEGRPDRTRDELLASATSLHARKERESEAIRQAKEIAKAASADISVELAGFNSQFIKPLGHLMSRINQAILCDPRVGIDFHVKKKKIEQSATKGSEVPKAVGEIDPMLVHSEGQMAALSVSMLCAASLTFPWSRWKALVLDDPLQHNDSIHAAAFADLMANLISAEGYQIFVSAHDASHADFMQRKFISRGIPCTRLNLLGFGDEGVEWATEVTQLTDSYTDESSDGAVAVSRYEVEGD